MTLQTTGAISSANVQTEFGGVNPVSMSEYYANGVYVPSGTSGTNGAVPLSGAISMSQFYGTATVTVSALFPGDNSAIGTTPFFFPAESVTTTGIITSYTWSISNPLGNGVWTVFSGQGTASAVIRISSMAVGQTAQCTVTLTVAAAGGPYTRTCTLDYERTV